SALIGLEPAIDGPPVWIVTVMPCCFAQRTIGAASLPVLTEPSPISPTSFTPAAAISAKSASVRPSSRIGAPASTFTPPGRMLVSASSSSPRPIAAMTPSRSTRESASRTGRRRSPLTSSPMLRTSVLTAPRLLGGGCPVQTRLHVLDVGGHDGAGLARLAGGDGLEDAPVSGLDLGVVGLGELHARRHDLRLQRHERVGHDGVDGIVGGVGQQPVELEVRAS